MTSWMILSCVTEKTELPQRFAGIMNRYSKNAMPQLARMTSQSGELLNFGFKLPYHANVIKMFEQVSSTIGSQRDEVKSMPQKMNSPTGGVKWECADFQSRSGARKPTVKP